MSSPLKSLLEAELAARLHTLSTEQLLALAVATPRRRASRSGTHLIAAPQTPVRAPRELYAAAEQPTTISQAVIAVASRSRATLTSTEIVRQVQGIIRGAKETSVRSEISRLASAGRLRRTESAAPGAPNSYRAA